MLLTRAPESVCRAAIDSTTINIASVIESFGIRRWESRCLTPVRDQIWNQPNVGYANKGGIPTQAGHDDHRREAMKITKEFEVAGPIDAVWECFQDVPGLADCLPGATLADQKGDGLYAGSVFVKLGPMSAMFEGEATVTPDPAGNGATISGKGVDRRGGSRAQVKVDYRLTTFNSKTKVTVDADLTLSGSAAQFGRTGLINEIANRLIGEFVDCLEKKLEAATPEEAAAVAAREVHGIRLFLASLGSWIAKLFKRLLGLR